MQCNAMWQISPFRHIGSFSIYSYLLGIDPGRHLHGWLLLQGGEDQGEHHGEADKGGGQDDLD